MADSRRLDMMQATEAAIEVASVTKNAETTTKPLNLTVIREATRAMTVEDAPVVHVAYGGETVVDRESDAVGESRREVEIEVTVIAKATETQRADEALDPLLVWCELAVMNDYTLGGTSAFVRLARIERLQVSEHADVFAAASMTFGATLLTKYGDPRQAP